MLQVTRGNVKLFQTSCYIDFRLQINKRTFCLSTQFLVFLCTPSPCFPLSCFPLILFIYSYFCRAFCPRASHISHFANVSLTFRPDAYKRFPPCRTITNAYIHIENTRQNKSLDGAVTSSVIKAAFRKTARVCAPGDTEKRQSEREREREGILSLN